jgi:hypothetical protein
MLHDGFHTRGHHGDATITVPRADGGIDTLDPDQAAARYVGVLRNATHGHGAKSPDAALIANALLAHHDGQLPHDLALVGYLYLLDVLSRPEDLALRLYRGGAV